MAQATEHTDIVYPILSHREAFEVFDGETRRLMVGMGGEEFIQRWQTGEFDTIADEPGHRHIMRLILMMPGVDHESE